MPLPAPFGAGRSHAVLGSQGLATSSAILHFSDRAGTQTRCPPGPLGPVLPPPGTCGRAESWQQLGAGVGRAAGLRTLCASGTRSFLSLLPGPALLFLHWGFMAALYN